MPPSHVSHIYQTLVLCESHEKVFCFEAPEPQTILDYTQIKLFLLPKLVILQYVNTNPSEASFIAGA